MLLFKSKKIFNIFIEDSADVPQNMMSCDLASKGR